MRGGRSAGRPRSREAHGTLPRGADAPTLRPHRRGDREWPAFKSTERYIASRDLEVAVNAAVTLQRPLLVKGEPGTGKTVLAHEVARRSAIR